MPTRLLSHSFSAAAVIATVLGVVSYIFGWLPASMAQSPPTGLVAAYNFDEGSGSTVHDLSGNNISGTISGATWTTQGRFGGALSFNGTSSYVDLGNPAALQLTGSMTLEAWIRAAANPPDDGQIVAKSDDLAGWQFKTSPDTGPETFGLRVTTASGASIQRYTVATRSLNTWYHFAAVYNAPAAAMDIYVNGVLNNGVLRGSIPTLQQNASVNVNIGRRTGGYYFNGIIDDIRIYNRPLSATEIQADMMTPVGGSPPPPDITPPTVSLTAPADGATVAGTISVSASASDNVGVAGVQFLLDGNSLGTEVVSAPYTLRWNTATVPNGVHSVAAIARDFAGNTTRSAAVSVTIAQPGPDQVGAWSQVFNWPIVAVHASLLPTGDVVAWTDYTDNQGAQVWHPATNTFVPVTLSTANLFCSAHGLMADGRLFVVGGTLVVDDAGLRDGYIFDPATLSWSHASALMQYARYYPTTVKLGDGRFLVLGGTINCGSCIADIPEIYDPVANTWTQLVKAKLAFKYYPHPFLLPDGRVLVSSQDDTAISSRILDINAQTWTTIDTAVRDGHSAVMFSPGKVLKAGTATADNPGLSSAATSYVLDTAQTAAAWKSAGSMAFPRSFLNLTVLPDGQVLATGGGTTTDPANFANAVYAAELWSPATQSWTTMSSMQTPRLYHSTALLMPDARVLVAGGGRQNGRSQPDPADQLNAEIFSPPYLFKGARPAISSAPALLSYGSSFAVSTPDAATIGSVSLVALGSVTHAFNENQRYIALTFQQSGSGLSVQAPANGNLAPPGPYMLFLVNTNGVPSNAAMVRLPAPAEDVQPPTAPGNLKVTAVGSTATLSWSASTDNVGVTGYSVYRSITTGFAPTASTKIGQTSTTTYTDTTLAAAGTYYYVVTAQDAKGNISPPSNEASFSVVLDTTPPSVSITAPVAGATVSATVAVTASASDDIAMGGVQFLLDGTNLAAEVTGPGPTYTLNWNTASALNGSHVLSAKARDWAGNIGIAANVTITVTNTEPAGLTAGYSFNQGSGTTVIDSSGNGITGTISGATWTTAGKYGSALSFNGTSSYVDLGNPALLKSTGSMSWSAWVKAVAMPTGDAQIIAKSNNTSGWQVKTSLDTGVRTFAVAISAATGRTQRYSKTVPVLNTWYHVAGVYNAAAKTLDIYVNGVLDNGVLSGIVPGSQSLPNVNVNIGRRSGGFYFNGTIDEVRIYNRALFAAEIQTLMSTPMP